VLLGAQADVNSRDYKGNTALQWAAWNGAADIVEALLLARANAWVSDDFKVVYCVLWTASVVCIVDCV
jgi:ankyrin repeat protein